MDPQQRLSNARLKARLTLAAILLLVAGLTSAALIHAFADEVQLSSRTFKPRCL